MQIFETSNGDLVSETKLQPPVAGGELVPISVQYASKIDNFVIVYAARDPAMETTTLVTKVDESGLEIGKPVAVGTGLPLAAAMSPVGDNLAIALSGGARASAAGGARIVVVQVASGRSDTLGETPTATLALAFDPAGGQLATAGQYDHVAFWDVASRSPVAEVKVLSGGAMDAVRSIAYSHDGRLLAAGSEHNVLTVVDTASRSPISPAATSPLTRIDTLAFLPLRGARHWIAAAGIDGTVRLVGLDSCPVDDPSSNCALALGGTSEGRG